MSESLFSSMFGAHALPVLRQYHGAKGVLSIFLRGRDGVEQALVSNGDCVIFHEAEEDEFDAGNRDIKELMITVEYQFTSQEDTVPRRLAEARFVLSQLTGQLAELNGQSWDLERVVSRSSNHLRMDLKLTAEQGFSRTALRVEDD